MYKQPKDRLLYVISAFLNGAEPRSTWRVIVDALRNPVVNLLALARKIEAAHISDPASTPDMAPEATTTTDKATTGSTSAKEVPETTTAGSDIVAVPQSTTASEPVLETTPTEKDPATGTATGGEVVKYKPPSQPSPDTGSKSEIAALEGEVKGLHKRFSAIKESTIHCLERCRIKVMAVVYMLTSVLSVFEHKKYLKENHKALRQCEDHWELFGELNLHWNYLSYGLMDGLVDELACRNNAFITIQEQMTVYKEDMLEFRRRTTLVLFCKVSPTILRISEADPSGISEVDLQKMVTEHQWPQTVTLEDVEQFRKGFLRTFSLTECAVMVHRIRTGSFEVTWFVFLPPTIIQLLKESRGRIWVFKDFKVSSAVIDGELVYQPSHHKPATPIPLPASEMTATTTDPLMEEAHCVVPS
jgi:hypothetical protein